MGTRSQSSVSAGRVALLGLLAVVYAGLNVPKPLTIDDAAYHYFARQSADHPLDPYGFALQWYSSPNRANDILAPPVLPYYWGLALRFDDRPWVWKLTLLPWCLLLVGSLFALLRRFARELEMPLTWFTVLSPALLPSLNLMLDVPALALSLASISLFLSACDRASFGRAALAGLLAGLAMETKYTGFLAPGTMLLATAVTRQWRLWPVAALTAGQVFATWEFLVALLYGQSHFLNQLGDNGPLLDKVVMTAPLVSILGSVAAPGLLLGLAALGTRRRWLAATAAILLAGYAFIILFDATFTGVLSPRLFGPCDTPFGGVQLAEIVFDTFGLAGAVVLAVVLRRLFSGDGGDGEADRGSRRDTLFLVLWFGLETVGYFPLTPFPAVRRVLGIGIVLTLLLARLAARTMQTPERRAVLRAVITCGILLGLAYAALDLRDANAQKQAAEEARAWIEEHGGGRVWHVGHWGFQFYAEQCGMKPVITEYNERPSTEEEGTGPRPKEVPLPPPSRLDKGDWLVVPSARLNQQLLYLDERKLQLKARLTIEDALPLRTVQNFYGGRSALEHHEGPRLEVAIYRVLEDFTPVAEKKE
jgi:hypothetical protein